MEPEPKTTSVQAGLAGLFLALASIFLLDLWARPALLPSIPLVDPAFTNTATVRLSAAELTRTGGDTSGLDCYVCHEKNKPLKLRFDANKKIILPTEHQDIVMGHGRHDRNNHCFNCHDEANLELLQTRDGRELKLVESTPLCGSCHGPTYRDWEAGVHGRTGGFWSRAIGPSTRQDCVSCHNPHSPAFPPRQPAPGPHSLHPPGKALSQKAATG
jgi:hypothetical protein